MRSGGLLDYVLWRPGASDGVGGIHRGRIEAVVPALGGAFVRIEMGVGFLPLSAGSLPRPEGATVLVRVARAAQGDKGPRLTAEPEREGVAAEGPVGLVRQPPSPLAQLADRHALAMITVDDPALRAAVPPALQARMSIAADPFSSEVEDQVAALAEPVIRLPGGMRASIHPTPALVAIDLDTGGGGVGRTSKAVAQVAANRLALPALLHQLRLRNLSGAILLDLAGIPSRKRHVLRGDIEAALSADPLGPKLLGFTALGLVEILRPRIHPPLHELLAGPHAAALAALRAASAAMVAAAGAGRPVIAVSPDVVAAMDADVEASRWFLDRHGVMPSFRSRPELESCSWRLENA